MGQNNCVAGLCLLSKRPPTCLPDMPAPSKSVAAGVDRRRKNDETPEFSEMNDSRFAFISSVQQAKTFAAFQKQRLDGQFLDITIQVGDVTVQAHRSILSAISTYFQTFFDSNMADSAALDEIKSNDVKGNAFKEIVEFAYTGTLDVSPENVRDLLAASSFLGVDWVFDACCSFLRRRPNLSVENCFEILHVASTYGRVELNQFVWTFLLDHFEDLTNHDSFLNIPIQLLLKILEDDKLFLTHDGFLVLPSTQEEQLLEVTLRYIKAEPENRLTHLPLLLERGIRLLLITPEMLETVKRNPLIASSPDSLRLLDEALSSDVSKSKKRKCWSKPRVVTVRFEAAKVLTYTRALPANEPDHGQFVMFDDSDRMKTCRIFYVTGMKIYVGSWNERTAVGGIEVSYSNGDSILHGRSDGYGYENYEFRLDSDERITSITTRSGWVVDQLTFKTNKGKVLGPYGRLGGREQLLRSQSSGAYLGYMKGVVEVTKKSAAIRCLYFFWGFAEIQKTFVN